MTKQQSCTGEEVVGLIPMAGMASRLAPLPFSKELYPIGFDESGRPKAVCRYVLGQMRFAGVRQAFVILRAGKWDIPAYLQDGAIVGMHLAYLIVGPTHGTPYSLDQAFHFLGRRRVVVGWADMIYEPDDLFRRLLDKQEATGADVALAVFPAVDPTKVSVVELDDERVVRVIEKPQRTHLRQAYVAASWSPRFTRFLHDYLAEKQPEELLARAAEGSRLRNDVPLSLVLQAAIDEGLRVVAATFPGGRYQDIGTPDDLAAAARDILA